MRRPQTWEVRKDMLVTELREARRELLGAVAAVPGDQCRTPFLGVWSVTDLVAHLAGWDYANLSAIQAVLAGRLPEFYSRYDPDWRSFNAELVAANRCETLGETVRGAQASHDALFAALTALPAEAVFSDHGVRSPRGRRVTIAMLLTAEARDERVHCAQVRRFLETLAECSFFDPR